MAGRATGDLEKRLSVAADLRLSLSARGSRCPQHGSRWMSHTVVPRFRERVSKDQGEVARLRGLASGIQDPMSTHVSWSGTSTEASPDPKEEVRCHLSVMSTAEGLS